MPYNLQKSSSSTAFSKKSLFICSISILILFLGFFTNYWRVADQKWFENFQHDSESLIIGRMVKSGQDGMFSDGGLTGYGSLDAAPAPYIEKTFSNQYLAYNHGLVFGSYSTYNSQIGGQGMLFGMLDKLIPISHQEKLRLFYGLTSLFSAVMVTALIFWFYLEFGLTVALFVFTSAVFSQWLVVFGRNLWWSIWAFYLPVVTIMYYIKFKCTDININRSMLGVLVFTTIFIKCLFTGYEYITSTLVMMIVPFVYYSVLKCLNFHEFFACCFTAASSSCFAILLSFLILCLQIASVEGNFLDGINHIIYSFEKRTFEAPNQEEGGGALTLDFKNAYVVLDYLKGTFFDANNALFSSSPFITKYLLKVRYLYLILLFMIMSGILYSIRNKHVIDQYERKSIALIYATWFSILAPLSWFIIFREHSYIHQHMNHIVWQMPFVFFGFAVCGLVVKSLLPDLISLKRRALLFRFAS